jgi:hypothetical protein
MKGAIIIRGEYFREGGQGTRIKYTPLSVEEQILALESHAKLFEKITDQGGDFDIFILTHDMPEDLLNLIKEKYSRFASNIKNITFSGNGQGHEALAPIIREHHREQKYKYVFMFRPDQIFKELFLKIFSIYDEKIKLSSVCFKLRGFRHHLLDNDLPRVSDTMFFYPTSFVERFIEEFIEMHHFHNYFDILPISVDDVEFYVNTFHDSDSAKDFNPLYRMAGRPECTKWHSEGLKYPDDLLNDKYAD